MANRNALLLSALLAGVVLSVSSVQAADECLAKPKGLAPAGKHWYYSTNRTLQRKCWYLDDENERTVAATPRKQQPAKTPANPPPEAGEPREAANARAELVDEPRAEQPSPSPSLISPALSPLAAQQAPADQSNAPNWTMALRWPESSDAFAASSAPMRLQSAPPQEPERVQPVEEAPVAQQPPAAAPLAMSFDLDVGAIGAIAIFVVVVGGTIVIFGRRRRTADRDGSTGDSMYAAEMPWMRTAAAAKSAFEALPEQDERNDRIEEIERLLADQRQTRWS